MKDAEPRSLPRGPRVHAIDLLRLIASIQMIAGHTIGALLAPEHATGAFYDGWTVARGLTAVAFLFAAGAAFALVAVDAPKERARRRIVRAAGLIVLGYALHPPAAALGGDPALAASAWRELFAVDVLGCIGVTLLVLEALVRLPRFALSAGVLAVVVFLVSPLAASIAPEGPLLPFANYLTRRAGSLFPLAPYAGFLLAGAALGGVAFRGRFVPARVAAAAAVTLSVGALAWTRTSPPADAYYAWPALSFMRLGAVLALTAALALATVGVTRLPRVITVLAGQSLFLYVSHLLVLYVGGVGLVRWIGPTLSVPEALGAALTMISLSAGGALVFARRPRSLGGASRPITRR